jgi:hypothetical protein
MGILRLCTLMAGPREGQLQTSVARYWEILTTHIIQDEIGVGDVQFSR